MSILILSALIRFMLGRINFINYEKCYPSRLKKIFQSGINYHSYDEFIPQMKNAVTGNIPPEITELFKENKGEKIKSFQKTLSNLAEYLRGCYKGAKDQNLISYDIAEFADDLPLFEKSISEYALKAFKNILPEGIYPELSYTGKGVWGNVFKFSLKNKNGEKIMHDKAFKVYHNTKCKLKDISHIQNNFAEANFWTYLKYHAGHKLDKTQFTRHYISDAKSGYAMTEFIDDKIQKTTAPIDFENILGITYMDIMNEPINGKLYDAGGFSKDNRLKSSGFIDDKIVLRYFKKLWFRNSEKELSKTIQDFEQKIANPKTPHRDKIQRALELFKQKKNIDN